MSFSKTYLAKRSIKGKYCKNNQHGKELSVQTSSWISEPKIIINKQHEIIDVKNIRTKDIIDIDDDNTSNSNYIFRMDNVIKETLLKENNLDEMHNSLKNLLLSYDNCTDIMDRIAIKIKIDDTRKKIRDTEIGFNLLFYLMRTEHILSEYKQLAKNEKPRIFFNVNKTNINQNYEIEKKKKKLINTYLSISGEYISPREKQKSYYRKKSNKDKINNNSSIRCDTCGRKNLSINEENLTAICPCGMIIEVLDDSPTFKDTERVNMTTRYTYTCRGHFVEAMNCFEGKLNSSVTQDIINLIIRELKFNNTFNAPTKDHIYMILNENKLSDHYANINLIHFLITNIKPPDISEYRNELLEMHPQIEEAYNMVKDVNRLNSLNVNWKLYKMLQLVGYSCKKEDFLCLKTATKQVEHEEKWKEMMNYLSKTYPNSLTSKGQKKWRIIKTY